MSELNGKRIEIDRFPKNTEEMVVIALQEHYGELVVDIRSGVVRADGLRLTRKGLTLRAVQLPRLVQALHKALDRLEIKEVKPDDEPMPWDESPSDDDEFPF
jgi:hypothetical protein